MVEPAGRALRRSALAAVLLAVVALLLPTALRAAADASRLAASSGHERPIAAAVLSVPTLSAHRTPVHDLGGPGAVVVEAVGLGALLLLVGVRRRAAAPAVAGFSTPTRGRAPPMTTHPQ